MDPKNLLPSHVAAAMSLDEKRLWSVARNLGLFYKPPRKIRVKGKPREIDAPRYLFKKKLRRLHKFLQKNFRPHPSVHGGAKRRSCFTSAELHCGNKFIVSRDINDCYPSITEDALRQRLCKLGFRSDTALLLSALLTYRGRVAQGSPVSADALNFFLKEADHRIATICGRTNLSFGRTYDDLVISASNFQSAQMAGKVLERNIREYDLKVNRKKRSELGLQSSGQRPTVHNLLVNNKRGVAIVREQVHKALDLANSYVRSARVISYESLEAIAYKRSMVHGWICYCQQARFSPASELRRLLGIGDRIVGSKLRTLGLAAYRGKWWLVSKIRNEPRRLSGLWRKNVLIGLTELSNVNGSFSTSSASIGVYPYG